VNVAYDWASFYSMLCERGARLFTGIDEETREIIVLTATTDAFWSDGLQSVLGLRASEGQIREGVIDTIQVWRDNVITVLYDYGIDMDWSEVVIDLDHPVIDELVEAAQPES
jgi:hypothetical protein